MKDPVVEKHLTGHKDTVSSVAFHPKPSTLGRKNETLCQVSSSCHDGCLTVWNLVKHSQEVRAYRFAGHTGPVHHLSYSSSGSLLASCSSDRTVRLWVPKVNGDSVILRGHTGPVRCVDFSHGEGGNNDDESSLITCSDDKTVKIWSLPQKTFRCSLLGHTNWVRSCKFSPDSPYICASGGDDGTVRLWDVNQAKNVVTYTQEKRKGYRKGPDSSLYGVNNIAFHPSGTTLAMCSNDNTICFYDLRSDSAIHTIYGEGHSLGSTKSGIAFEPINGNYFLCHTNENSTSFIKMFDYRKTSFAFCVRQALSENSKHSNDLMVSCCSFSNDGSRFASGGCDKNVQLWTYDSESCMHKEGDNEEKNSSDDEKDTITPVEKEFVLDSVEDHNLDKERKVFNTAFKQQSLSTTQESLLPGVLTGTLDHIVGQLDLITQTVALIEKRLSIQEGVVESMRKTLKKGDTVSN